MTSTKTKLRKKAAETGIFAPEATKVSLQADPFEISKSVLCYRNHLVPELRKIYPEYPRLWVVDQFFPDAAGGPLYVDTMHRYWDEEFYKKQVAAHKVRAGLMKAAGLRYLYITPGMSMDEAFEQLGEK